MPELGKVHLQQYYFILLHFTAFSRVARLRREELATRNTLTLTKSLSFSILDYFTGVRKTHLESGGCIVKLHETYGWFNNLSSRHLRRAV